MTGSAICINWIFQWIWLILVLYFISHSCFVLTFYFCFYFYTHFLFYFCFPPHTHTSSFLPSLSFNVASPRSVEAGDVCVWCGVRIFLLLSPSSGLAKGMKDGARRWPLPHGRRDPPAAVLLAGSSCSLGSLVAPTPHPSFPISAFPSLPLPPSLLPPHLALLGPTSLGRPACSPVALHDGGCVFSSLSMSFPPSAWPFGVPCNPHYARLWSSWTGLSAHSSQDMVFFLPFPGFT